MAFFDFKNIKITGVASAVPKNRVSVDHFKEIYGEESVEKFKKNVGVHEFRKTNDNQTASDLGYVAAKRILKEKGMAAEEVDGLIFVSLSTDYRRPATACVLHKRLGLKKDCVAFDVGHGCSGLLYGLQIACAMMATSDMRKVLLVVAESVGKLTNERDRSCAMLLGDAGSALLLEKGMEESAIRGILCTDGAGYQAVIVPGGGFRNMSPSCEVMEWKDGNYRTLYDINMNGMDVFSFATTDVPRTMQEFFERTCTGVDDYDCFAIHQANLMILKQLQKKFKIPKEKMPVSMDKYGNVSGPSNALTLCDAYGKEMKKENIHILFCGFGVGLSWGVADAVINVGDVYPVEETDEYFEEGIICGPDDMK